MWRISIMQKSSLFGIAASSSAELQAVADHTQLMIPAMTSRFTIAVLLDFWGRHLLSLLGSGAYRVCPLSVDLTKQLNWFKRFSWAFLLVNVIGLPSATTLIRLLRPGMRSTMASKAVLNTPGNVAAVWARWDE